MASESEISAPSLTVGFSKLEYWVWRILFITMALSFVIVGSIYFFFAVKFAGFGIDFHLMTEFRDYLPISSSNMLLFSAFLGVKGILMFACAYVFRIGFRMPHELWLSTPEFLERRLNGRVADHVRWNEFDYVDMAWRRPTFVFGGSKIPINKYSRLTVSDVESLLEMGGFDSGTDVRMNRFNRFWRKFF